MSEDSSTIKTFVFAVSLIGIFVLLINSMPSGFFILTDTYFEYDYPDIYDPATMASLNFTDSESFLLSFTTGVPSGNYTDFSLGGNDLRVSSYTSGDEIFIVEHNTPWWIFNMLHEMLDQNQVFQHTNTTTSYYFDSSNNMSTFSVDCEHLEVICLTTFNSTKFNSYNDAWDGKEIYLTVGIGLDQIATTTGAWELLTNLLFFQMPNIHPVINAIIAIPIYAMFAILIFIVIKEILPFT